MRKTFFILGVLLLFVPFKIKAYGVGSTLGARQLSLGDTSVAINNEWSIINNPAGLASCRDMSLALYYENRFMLKETALKNAVGVAPFNFGTFAISAQQYGFSDYNENRLVFAFARSFGPNIRIGLSLDYLSFKFSGDYTKTYGVTFGLGAQTNLSDKLTVGAYIFNPLQIKLKTPTESQVPAVMKIGAKYEACKEISVYAELRHETDVGLKVESGIEYQLLETLFLRAGASSNPAVFSFGLGYSFSRFTFDIAAQTHSDLGWSMQGNIIIKIKSNGGTAHEMD